MLVKGDEDFTQFEPELGEDGPIHEDVVVKLPHPIIEMDVVHLVANRQGQHVLPVQGVACCSPGSLTDNVRCGADVAILLFFDGPHPAFFLAIGIGEVFLKSAGVALLLALKNDEQKKEVFLRIC